jgi:hypothetical protein
MCKLLSITSAAVVVLGGLTAECSELPAFEKLGFPITQTQVSALGSADVGESSPVPTLTLGGMPASPHQIAVLTPRSRIAEDGRSRVLNALILICSVAATPDLQDCTSSNAPTVMRLPAEFGNPATCFMHAQAYLAGTSIGRELEAGERIKVVCTRSEILASSKQPQ